MASSECPICKADNITLAAHSGGADRSVIVCPNCGRYEISGTAYATFSNKVKDAKLSFAIRTRFYRDEHVYVSASNREEILAGIFVPVKVKDIAELVLVKVFTDEDNKSKELALSMENALQFGIENDTKMQMVLNYIESKGWFKLLRFSGGGAHLSLTGEGISHAEDIINPNYESKQVFVAMSFNPELDTLYSDAIQEAVKHCHLTALRSKDFDFNDEVIKNIQLQIDSSRFVIADFTDNRPGVYYEAGYATGRYIPVIYCCRESDKVHIHFDIDHFNFIFWSDLEGLKSDLIKRITKTNLSG